MGCSFCFKFRRANQFWSFSLVDLKCFSTRVEKSSQSVSHTPLRIAFSWLLAKSPALPPTMRESMVEIAFRSGSAAVFSCRQLRTHVHHSSNFFPGEPLKFPGPEKIFESFGSKGALVPALSPLVGIARSCAFNWSTSCDKFMFRILVASSASCWASINSLSSPARSPQVPPDNPATDKAAAKLVGREEDMLY